MPLDLSTYNYTPATSNRGTVNISQLRFKPSVGEVPAYRIQSGIRFSCWGENDIPLLFGTASAINRSDFLWSDDTIPADFGSLESGHRVTDISLVTAPNVIDTEWDRFELIDVSRLEFNIVGSSSGLLFAASDALLDENFYPTPTHIFIDYEAFEGASILSSEAATHPRAVIQPYRYDIWRGSSPTNRFQGIGPLGANGTRLLTKPFLNSAFRGFDTQWFRQSDGVALFSDLSANGPQFLNGYLPLPQATRPLRSAAYGLPPEVELSGQWLSSTEGGATMPTSVELLLHLVEVDLDGNETDTVVSTTTMPLVSSGANYKTHILNPTNSSSVGTLDDSTIYFRYRYTFQINGSIAVPFGSPDSVGPAPYQSSGGHAYIWHKTPCSVTAFGVTGAYANEGDQYLPGWLYDPSA